jgi:hypothetical protein
MIFKTDPTLKIFADDFNEIVDDCMDKDGNVASHKFPAHIYVEVEGDDSDDEYSIMALDIDYLGGCGCPSGITIRIKKNNSIL